MDALCGWIRQIAYIMVLTTVILQMAAGKQYQKYIRMYTGIILALVMMTPVLRLFGTDASELLHQAEQRYEEMVGQIEERAEEIEQTADAVGRQKNISEEMNAEQSGQIEVEEIRIGR